MDTFPTSYSSSTRGADIIAKAESVGLDPRVLYEAVIDETIPKRGLSRL